MDIKNVRTIIYCSLVALKSKYLRSRILEDLEDLMQKVIRLLSFHNITDQILLGPSMFDFVNVGYKFTQPVCKCRPFVMSIS